jgi:predicted CXXCH cytochrome family protein
MRTLTLASASLALLLVAATTQAGDKRLAPLPKDQATVVHGPYEEGACEVCHERADPKNPGAARASDSTCLDCHDEFGGKAAVRISPGKSHPSSGERCISCHNPHNAKKKKLLL